MFILDFRFIRVHPRDYWSEVKKEIYLLLCTKDKKYSDIRSRFSKDSNTATTAVVSMLSAAIAAQIGVVAGIVTPLVSLLLYGILKLGLNSWCNLQSSQIEQTSKTVKNKKPRELGK
jgi:hypothetical protein